MATEFIPDAGGSIITLSVLRNETPLKWAVRETSLNPQDNGWRFFGQADTEEYLADPSNLTVVDFNRVAEIEPAIIPIWNLPIGSDLQIERDATGIRILDNRSGRVVIGPPAGVDPVDPPSPDVGVTTSSSSEVLEVWASIAGLSASTASPETIVGWGDADVAYEIRPSQQRFAVVKVERSASVIGTFSDQATAECLLILLMARLWRSREGLPRAEASELAPRTEIDEGPISTDLRWDGGDAEFASGRPGRFVALDVSHLVWRTPQQITDELLMPDASGLFMPPV